MYFAVWFVRIRDTVHTLNASDGILKIEKILVNDKQIELQVSATVAAEWDEAGAA